MQIGVGKIVASLDLILPPPPAPTPLKSTLERTPLVLVERVARLERQADDHARRIAGGRPSRSPERRRSSASPMGGAPPIGGGALRVPASGSAPSVGGGAPRSSRGEPLGSLLGRLEGHFGRPLGDVRVHTDPAAAEAASRLSARAFTVGSHIYFGAGQFRPDTPGGLGLIGHEVAHVDQFHRGLTPTSTAHAKAFGLDIGARADRLERFAEDHERRIASGRPAPIGAEPSIDGVSVSLTGVVGPEAGAKLDRIVEGAVAEASVLLARERLNAEVDTVSLRVKVDPSRSESLQVRRLAGEILRAARIQALKARWTPASARPISVQLARTPKAIVEDLKTRLGGVLELPDSGKNPEVKKQLRDAIDGLRENADDAAVVRLRNAIAEYRKANSSRGDTSAALEQAAISFEKLTLEMVAEREMQSGKRRTDSGPNGRAAHVASVVQSVLAQVRAWNRESEAVMVNVWMPDQAAAQELINAINTAIGKEGSCEAAPRGFEHHVGGSGPDWLHLNAEGQYQGKEFAMHVFTGESCPTEARVEDARPIQARARDVLESKAVWVEYGQEIEILEAIQAVIGDEGILSDFDGFKSAQVENTPHVRVDGTFRGTAFNGLVLVNKRW